MTDEVLSTKCTWQRIIDHDDYEISDEYPYQIRKISSGKIIKESINGSGYLRVKLNGVDYYKHRLIAIQFIPNPNNYPEVDHKEKIRTDNHIENLRWVTSSDNNKNRTSSHGIVYEWIEDSDLPDDLIEVKNYGNHEFEDYYYSPSLDRFMFWNGIKTRLLHILYKRNGKERSSQAQRASAFVQTLDKNNKLVQIYYSKFKKLIH